MVEQVVRGTIWRADLFTEFVIWTVSQIINGNDKTIYVSSKRSLWLYIRVGDKSLAEELIYIIPWSFFSRYLPWLLEALFSEREREFTFAICCRPSVCLSVCLSSVTLVHPTQAVQIFGNISTAFGTLAIRWHPLKISRRSSQGNPSDGGVKHKRGREVAKYRDFGPIDGYISETVQDRR